ncbi:hypothetical protein LAZ67_15002505 [Cordylochernes scorpioides]|uniref:Mariner Mos1 transposase n=1 Tax=Cordylochernes scorpioides TaxID=51811 RepID=A0ABY6LD69_9ARAC|nr:hypothetical protein LAZ67_15002505 [Cordylochernes scorpioides]
MFNSDPHWLKYVITGDETWVYGYDPETKKQSSQRLEPGELRFKKARMIKSKFKVAKYCQVTLQLRSQEDPWDTCQSSLESGGTHRCEGFSESDQQIRKTVAKYCQVALQLQSQEALWDTCQSSLDFGETGNFIDKKPRKCTQNQIIDQRNPRITIRELSEDLDISFGTCQTIIKNDLHLKRSPAKFVPHLLTNEQKEHLI